MPGVGVSVPNVATLRHSGGTPTPTPGPAYPIIADFLNDDYHDANGPLDLASLIPDVSKRTVNGLECRENDPSIVFMGELSNALLQPTGSALFFWNVGTGSRCFATSNRTDDNQESFSLTTYDWGVDLTAYDDDNTLDAFNNENPMDGQHRFAILWSPSRLAFSVDGAAVIEDVSTTLVLSDIIQSILCGFEEGDVMGAGTNNDVYKIEVYPPLTDAELRNLSD